MTMLWMLGKQSRNYEKEADLESFKIYPDPNVLPNALDKMCGNDSKKKKAGFLSKAKYLFATHPSNDQRRKRLSSLYEKMQVQK